MDQKIQKNETNKETSLINKINNPELKEILLILTSNKIINLGKINPKGDIEENTKQGIKESLTDKFGGINEIFSELRKSGKDLGVLNFKLIMLSLKIKMFLSTYEKKDLENLLKRMQEIEAEINKLNK